MMRRSSAQHGKLQKSWPLPWHHGMSNLTHVSRPFSCAAGLGAGGTDAIGLVLSVHLRASLDNFFSLRCFDFLRHNQIYQWDTPCTNIHSKYIYIYIYIHYMYIYIYLCVCVSTSGFPIFLQGIDTYWYPSLHFLMISLQDLKLQAIFFQWWRTTEQMANRLSGQTVNMYLKKVDLAVFFLGGAGEIMIHHQVLGYSIFGKSIILLKIICFNSAETDDVIRENQNVLFFRCWKNHHKHFFEHLSTIGS